MRIMAFLTVAAGLLLLPAAHAAPLTAEAINAAGWSQPRNKGLNPTVLKAQVLLGRAGFSPA